MTERTCRTGGALRFLVACTVPVALVAACFITVPVVRADSGLQEPVGPQSEKVGRQLVIRNAGGQQQQQPFASSNDTCAGADAIPAGTYPVLSTTQNIGNNTDAGDPPVPSCAAAGNAAQGGAWWSFTPTETNTYFFNDCNALAPGTTHDDTIIAVYSSSDNTCGGTLTQVGCSDDANTCPGFPFLSNASAAMTAGQTYFIVVWNWADPPATADVQIQVTKSLAPSNDTCAGATALPLNRTVRGNLLSASNNSSLADASCYTGISNNATGVCLGNGRDVYYQFTAPAAGLYSFRVRSETTQPNPPIVASSLNLYTATSCPGLASTCPGVITGASQKNYTNTAFNAYTRCTFASPQKLGASARRRAARSAGTGSSPSRRQRR